MTDRELLQLAAKAVGIDATYDDRWGGMLWLVTVQEPDDGCEFWNPLTNDGDALRLAVRLQITPGKFDDTIVASRSASWRMGPADCSLWEPAGDDPYAATRRAIVRAAAEIGRSMP